MSFCRYNNKTGGFNSDPQSVGKAFEHIEQGLQEMIAHAPG